MACADILASNSDLFNVVANKVLDSITEGFGKEGLKQIPRKYVGMGPIPSEDCCPDLVAWITNTRMWDSAAPDTLQENRILNHYGIAFDVNVRVGECFFEADGQGKLVTPSQIEAWAGVINRYGLTAYSYATSGLVNDPDMDCIASITPLPMSPYQEGGCAGFTFVITVAVV